MTLTLGPVIGKVGGAQVEEIPVSMNGGGSGTVYPLTTVDAGAGAFIAVGGTLSTSSFDAYRAYLRVGTLTFESASILLTGPSAIPRPGGYFTGIVQVAILSRTSSATSFTGTVYVARL